MEAQEEKPRDRLNKVAKPRQMVAFTFNGGLALGVMTRARAKKVENSEKQMVAITIQTLNTKGELCSYTINTNNFIVLHDDDCDEVAKYRTQINLALWKSREKED